MLLRLLITWVLNALTLLGIAYFGPAVGILTEDFALDGFESAAIAAVILAVLNLTVRPILKLLTLPITCLTFGLFALVLNAAMMLLTARIVVGFNVGGWWNALVASIAFAVVSAVLNGIFNKEKDKKDDRRD